MSLESNVLPDREEVNDRYLAFINDHDPVDIDEYREQKAIEILQGKTTWVLRNLILDKHVLDALVYDLYTNGRLYGYIDHEDQGADAYVVEEDGQPSLDRSFTLGFPSSNLISAIDYLESTLK